MAETIPMLLWCPECGERHIDEGEFAEKVHHTHCCQKCGMVWRPAIQSTVGVRFLPGFRSDRNGWKGRAEKVEADWRRLEVRLEAAETERDTLRVRWLNTEAERDTAFSNDAMVTDALAQRDAALAERDALLKQAEDRLTDEELLSALDNGNGR